MHRHSLHSTLTPPSEYLGHHARVPHAHHSTPARPASPNAQSYPTPASALPSKMTTPHRGLPPPHGMTLSDPAARGPPQLPPHADTLPPAPQQWPAAGGDDSMRNWLRAKEEEDRRKQEEEKTHQEELKLEQRRIEQTMLRDSLSAGVPVHLIPVMFAGLAGGPLAHFSLELVQQHFLQLQQAAAQPTLPAPPPPPPPPAFAAPLQSSPDLRRDGRHPPSQYTQTSQPPGPPLLPAAQQATVYPSPAYQSPAAKALYAPPTQGTFNVPPAPRIAAQAALPHLTTNEVAPQSTSSFSQQQEQSPSTSIYFHHWQPPGQANKDNEKKTSPNNPALVAGSDEPRDSPSRKRKSTAVHQPAPPPKQASPGASSTSSGSKEIRHVQPQRGEFRRAYDPLSENRRRHDSIDLKPPRGQDRRPLSPPRAS